jgi:4-hydroxybenzoate polyprenyltransferase
VTGPDPAVPAPDAGRPDPARPPWRPGRVGPAAVAAGMVRATHPGPVVAVTVLAGVLAVAAGRGPRGSALVVAAVLAGQLSIGWCNDTVDRDRDRRTRRPDKPVALGVVPARVTGAAAVLAFAACVPLSLASGALAGTVNLVTVASGWAYDLGLKATRASWLPYAVSFGLLPAVVTLGLPGQPWPPAWGLAGAALLGVGAHFANVLPDLDDDLTTGVRGLPQRLGRTGSRLAAAATLTAAVAVLALGPPGRAGAAGWLALAAAAGLAGAGILAPGRDRGRLPFRAAVGVAAVAVALLVLRGSALR